MNLKRLLGERIAQRVEDKQFLGLGSGTTSEEAIKAIGKRVKKEKLTVYGVPTSKKVASLASNMGIEILNLCDKKIDWGFDGADEVEKKTLNLIKGGGGAMTREKQVAKQCPFWIVIVDESKLVRKLGEKFPIPVEVKIKKMGIVRYTLTKTFNPKEIQIRQNEDGAGMFLTDNGNRILDLFVKPGSVKEDWEKKIDEIDGVVENGLFLSQYPDEVWVARTNGKIKVLKGKGKRV